MSELPLGKSVDYDRPYDPAILCPIARAPGRSQLGLSTPLPFYGWDIWNAYELSWLDLNGKPVVACGEFRVPADSPNIVESKSFKLYLNSLNQQRFIDAAAVTETLRRDLRSCLGVAPEITLSLSQGWGALKYGEPEGVCLDDISIEVADYHPAPQHLATSSNQVERVVFSRLLRSRCPVTAQPDWATVQIAYRGNEIDPAGLLAYIVSFRLHQDFHEQCVERIFQDVMQRCAPHQLTVYARYLRRGGLDINPYRSTENVTPVNLRLWQQ